MPHILHALPGKTLAASYENNSGFQNEKGHTECVTFIQQTLHAPPVTAWKEGKKVTQGDGAISAGTAIATFVKGRYSTGGSGNQHAAIYLGQNGTGIMVLDQWRAQGKVLSRTIPWKPHRPGLSNDGNAFSIIEW